ncbi:hypothetical protein [Aliarcobacter butzleri]|uniref:hypothetical protein n=3 Tax=Aliarcobacter butzleri TaxID=28197 RepID=UPI003B103EF9
MDMNKKIINNFQVFNNFISKLSTKDKKIASSIKMMYSVHMENYKDKINFLFLAKQLTRFVFKFFLILFYKVELVGSDKKLNSGIFKNTNIEEFISKETSIPIICLKKKIAFNLKFILIFKNMLRIIYFLLIDKSLNKKYILSLIHRLIDYEMTYHTVKIPIFKIILFEDDRSPSNLALIHFLRENNVTTVKYDNWLIDPINHNEINCEYYYYPSLYHKEIIERFECNRELKYIKGGFLFWDKLSNFKNEAKKDKYLIIYFTQFSIEIDVHKQYISDIIDTMNKYKIRGKVIVKVHPREEKSKYQELSNFFDNIEIIDKAYDNYMLISQANFCFSIFSTVSIEAKHIINNSYFINYDNIDIVDYNALGLDVIKNKDMLNEVLSECYIPILQENFIIRNNCQYPNSIKTLQNIINEGKF